MNNNQKCSKENPNKNANPISRLLFWWTKDLFWKGNHKNLELSDLYDPLDSDRSEKLGDLLERQWNYELQRKDTKPRLYKAIIRVFWKQYLVVSAFMFISTTALRIIQPILQGWIIDYFDAKENEKTTTKNEVLLYAVGLIVCTLTITFMVHHTFMKSQQIGMRLRTACSSLLYRKILRLNKISLTDTTAGQIVNLLSNDMLRVDELCMYFHFIWLMPIQFILIGYIMWRKIRFIMLIGIVCLLMMTIPIYMYFTVISRSIRAVVAELSDKRIEIMNQLISGIQVIKMYAWEKPFAKIVSITRSLEINKLKWILYIRTTYIGLLVIIERLVLFFTLISFVLLDNTLTAEVTYILATYFNTLQLTAALFFPQALILCGETMISFTRMENVLLLDEVSTIENAENKKPQISFMTWNKKNYKEKKEKRVVEQLSLKSLTEIELETPASVEFTAFSANWIPKRLPPTFCNISLKIEAKQLCALIGPVGSGKSSLLHAILRELPLGAGSLSILQNPLNDTMKYKQGFIIDNPNIKISYASQEPWLFVGTIRDNILFGQQYDKSRYMAVTKVCALVRDFRQLQHGDMTIIGERGVSLSGGQKARINLARAVYKKADIYLLDDPLSAVDTKVARHLYKNCIEGYLHDKTRILSTHQLQFIQKADIIILLEHGTVKMQGSYNDLVESNEEFIKTINRLTEDYKTVKEESSMGQDNQNKSLIERKISLNRNTSVRSTVSSVVSENEYSDFAADDKDEEKIATGTLPGAVYKQYLRYGGSYCKLILLGIIFVIAQLFASGTDYWVSYWTKLETLRENEKEGKSISSHYNYMFNNTFFSTIFTVDSNGLLETIPAIYIYTFCICFCTIFVLARSYLFMHVCMTSSTNMHNDMFSNILQATMHFFYTNPSGRILNRFSKDIGCVDELLPKVSLEGLQVFSVLCGIIIIQAIISQWIIIPLALLIIAIYISRKIYLDTAQDIKRLEGICKSPVFSHVNATLNGLSTIRSSGKNTQEMLRKEFDSLQDIHSGVWYLVISTSTAFSLFTDLCACCFMIYNCFFFILINSDNIFGGDVGLALSQSLLLIGMLQYGIRQSTEAVSQMTSVERILQYTNLPKESPLTMSDPPPPTWPSKGGITFNNVSMKYDKDKPPVLKNLTVSIEPGWKVGVVGRTGAGKSSLISALFRLSTEGMEGEIRIDETDISTLGLQELRSRISIIPQEPVLFSESLRYNLDPFAQFNDTVLWDSLREVELTEVALDEKVMQSGTNFSVGQRQLICLARAILRNNKILILDEATANIDSRTDEFIQCTIRSKFADCTVLTIAHRLNTIIDSDRIIVMNEGRIAEFGYPYELLHNNPKGLFSQMVEKTGTTMSQNLFQQAENAYHQKNCKRNLQLSRQNSSNSNKTVIND